MESVYFEYRNAAVRLIADSSTAACTQRRCKGFFTETSRWTKPTPWTIYAGVVPVGAAQWRTYTRQSITGEACAFKVDHATRQLLVDLPPGPWCSLYTLRMIRNVLRWELFHRHAIFLHASCVARDGMGIAILGATKSGKSTVTLDLLRQGGWQCVTDDELTVLVEPDGQLTGLGWPGAHRIRRNMLHLFPELSARLHEFSHPANQLPAEQHPHSGWLRLFPDELQQVYGCEMSPQVKLASAACLNWGPTSVQRHDQASVAIVVRIAWDILPERRPGYRPDTRMVAANKWQQQVFDPFMLEAFGVPPLAQMERNLQRIEQSLPGYEVTHYGHVDGKSLGHLVGIRT